MGIAIGFFFELKIIFKRFCTILNIKDKKMIAIDPETKIPLSLNQRIPNEGEKNIERL